MKRGNHSRSRISKGLVLMLALVLLVGVAAGGTLAWLMNKTEAVTNTFTAGKLFDKPETEFTLWEHKALDEDGDGEYTLSETEEVQDNSYLVLPGVNIPKDPTVDIVNLQEHAYLYLKVTAKTMPADVSWTVDTANWEQLTKYPGVYVYCGENAENNVIKAKRDTGEKSFTVGILTDNEITVDGDYASAEIPRIQFEAYMVQATGNGDSAAAAWANTYGAPTP